MINVLGKGSDDTITRKPRKKDVVISCKMNAKRSHKTTRPPKEKPDHRHMELTALIVRVAKTAPILARPFVLHAWERDLLPFSVTGCVGCPGIL